MMEKGVAIDSYIARIVRMVKRKSIAEMPLRF